MVHTFICVWVKLYTMVGVNAEVKDMTETEGGFIVDVMVTSLNVIPDEFQEIRARARALASTGFASSASGILDSVELGELERLTQTLSVRQEQSGRIEKKLYTVQVNMVFD